MSQHTVTLLSVITRYGLMQREQEVGGLTRTQNIILISSTVALQNNKGSNKYCLRQTLSVEQKPFCLGTQLSSTLSCTSVCGNKFI